MLNQKKELYAHQVEIVSKAIDTLSQQLNLTENLIAGYTQIISMPSIEYKTSRIALALPEDVSCCTSLLWRGRTTARPFFVTSVPLKLHNQP